MPGLMTQPTTPAEVYIDSRLRDEPPETATERARHAYQIHHPQRLSEELAGAEEKFEAELARRQEQPSAPPAPEPEAPTLDSMEQELTARIEELLRRRPALALKALSDPGAAERLAELESDRAAAELAREQVREARAEEERLAPIELAARKEEQKAKQLADKMEPREAALAAKVDTELAAVAKSIAEHRTVCRQEHEQRVKAGEARPTTAGWGRNTSYESAAFYALGQADVGDVIERAPSAVGHPPARPLAEAEES